MKMNFIKTLLLVTTFVSLITTSTNANAGWFFESEKKILLKQAEKTYDMALKANDEGREQDAIVLFSDACGQFSFLLNSYPEYKTEHVTDRFNICKQQIKFLQKKLTADDSTVSPFVEEKKNSSQSPNVQLDNEKQTKDTPKQTTAVEEKTTTSQKEIIVNKSSKSVKIEDEIPEAEPEKANSVVVSSNNPLINADEKTCIMLINGLFDSQKETDVVYFVDELIDIKGDKTPISIRCLYVKALISVGNKNMAMLQLDTLKKQDPNNPSVRSLIAALAIANGDLMEAMLQLDKIIEEYPKYAEARINYAYLLLMIDSTAYRTTAIDSYKLALKLGAKRDMVLEKNLNIILK